MKSVKFEWRACVVCAAFSSAHNSTLRLLQVLSHRSCSLWRCFIFHVPTHCKDDSHTFPANPSAIWHFKRQFIVIATLVLLSIGYFSSTFFPPKKQNTFIFWLSNFPHLGCLRTTNLSWYYSASYLVCCLYNNTLYPRSRDRDLGERVIAVLLCSILVAKIKENNKKILSTLPTLK